MIAQVCKQLVQRHRAQMPRIVHTRLLHAALSADHSTRAVHYVVRPSTPHIYRPDSLQMISRIRLLLSIAVVRSTSGVCTLDADSCKRQGNTVWNTGSRAGSALRVIALTRCFRLMCHKVTAIADATYRRSVFATRSVIVLLLAFRASSCMNFVPR